MDISEKEVLKKKDFLLCNYMQWNDTFKTALEKEHLLGLDQVNMIERRQEDSAKSRILLDRLKFKGRKGDLEKLADILENTCPSLTPLWYNRWLADEIREELKDQSCELTVSEGISHEAATIVHRQFGHGKRLSESEKKALILILCIETQKTLNIWKREIDRTEDDIRYQEELNDFKDDAVIRMSELLNDYISTNKARLPVRGGSLGKSIASHMAPPKTESIKPAALDNLKSGAKTLMEMIGASLLSAENLDNERSRVLNMVGATDKNKSQRVRLDEEISEAIERRRQELAGAEDSIQKKEQIYADLLKELNDAMQEAEKLNKNKEKNVNILLNEVHRAKEKAVEYNMEATELRRKLKAAKCDLHDWAERFEIIERGGRLNYIYKRDEKIFAKTHKKSSFEEDKVEDTDHFKQFEEYEKNFLAKKMTNQREIQSGKRTPLVKKLSDLGSATPDPTKGLSGSSQAKKSTVLPAIDDNMSAKGEDVRTISPESVATSTYHKPGQKQKVKLRKTKGKKTQQQAFKF